MINSGHSPPPPLPPSHAPLPPHAFSPPTPHPLLPLSHFPPPLFSTHLHPQRFTSPKPLAAEMKPQARRKPELSGPAKAMQPCSECGKCFSSWKALFGHMRCHPDREWRGINPPSHSQRSNFTDEEYEVAATLVLLAHGPPPAADEIVGGSIISSLSSSFDDTIRGLRKEEGKMIRRQLESGRINFRSHPSPPPPHCQNCFLLDLNMPPPLKSCDGEMNLVLDLKLGI